MKPPNQCSRINLVELKAQIMKKLGPECSKQYFCYLQKFLSLKLDKVDFNKLCLRILGRENIKLHNHFIHSILRNSCIGKPSSQASETADALSQSTQSVKEMISADGYQQNGIVISSNQASGSQGLLSGNDMLPISPRKARTCLRDRRTGDRPSALGPNLKGRFAPHQTNASQLSDCSAIMENGDFPSPSVAGSMRQTRNELPVVSIQTVDPAPIHSEDQHELSEKVRRKDASVVSPHGLPVSPTSKEGDQTGPPPPRNHRFIGAYSDGALLDSSVLRERIEHLVVRQGLEGVSLECANILNLGVDLYMKELIGSCLRLVGSNSGCQTNLHKQQTHMKLINGLKPGHHLQMLNNSTDLVPEEPKVHRRISLQDFTAAMNLRPPLGQDWPLLLEKISTHALEE